MSSGRVRAPFSCFTTCMLTLFCRTAGAAAHVSFLTSSQRPLSSSHCNSRILCGSSRMLNMMKAAAGDSSQLNRFVDVHCHIIHEQFAGEEDAVAQRAKEKGLEYCVVNGLEPQSNRAVLKLCDRHPSSLLPALGIYPLDAACNV